MKHNSEEPSKYAKQLLLKVRFSLLSEHALKYNLDSSITNNNELINVLKEVKAKKDSFQNNTNRYCSQNKFNILICGGNDRKSSKTVSDVHQVNVSNLNKVKRLPSMTIERINPEAVCLKGGVYVFGGRDKSGTHIMSIEKYSSLTNKWTVIAYMFDQRKNFCACAFMNKIFIFGGYYLENDYITNSCLQFETKEEKFSDEIFWKEVSGMKEERCGEACVVFKGSIVVSGGENDNRDVLNSVESYDVFADKWISMPNTVNNHNSNSHSLVVIKDKLFVIGFGRQSCEVFDNVCEKFIALKLPSITYNKPVPIGNEIFIFQERSLSVICYDVDKNRWFEESCEMTKHLCCFSLTKLPPF